MNDLPPGWALAKIGQLVGQDGIFADGDWVESKDQDPDGDVRLTQLADIGEGVFRDRSNRFLSSRKASELGCTYLASGDVLVARMSDPLGRACIFPGDLRPSVTAVDICIIRPGSHGADARWLMWWINTPQFRREVLSRQAGTTRKRVSRKNLASIEFPIPPLGEQQRIATAIDKCISQLDAAEAWLTHARRLRVTLRAAIVALAFGGRWPRRPFRDVASVEANLVDPAEYPDLPHIAPNHIEPHTGRLLPYRTIREDGVKSAKHHFRPGQIIYSKIRPYLAKAALVDFEGLSSADTYPVATDLEPRFLLRWMLSGEFTRLAAGQQGRSVLPKINREQLGRLPVPVPPLDVQRRIVDEIELKLSIIDSVAPEIDVAIRRSAALRRSILERAFSGKLVPQDPSDEPASVLLERIAARRATAEKANGGRRSRRATMRT
jgi:type I restriction enzyme S subunit